ncbi:hypothetical protein [Salinispora arenicola]|uniref:Uncharacterized protein n=2 Tax=Salinispora arenicola TaxID=168697 RepID=A0A542XHD4_SALAC|nr:hypothetical protein [Salinispora arenicola]MCN0154257.1 hypothetical protein [Salinispora arenicola]TQL35241.1 hypothetical protein FB564_0272 [Salinispora arenicola]
MTATSPRLAPGSRPSWRARWADRENDRRQRVHAADADAWRRRADELTRLRIEVGLLGTGRSRAAPVMLAPGEVVHRVFPNAELVEVVAGPAAPLPVPGLAVDLTGTDEPPGPLPQGIRAADVGKAVVTDRRVVFCGRHQRRVWWYEELAGPAHHDRSPLTLLPTTDGSPVAGLLIPPPATLAFRFYLTLAFADGLGNRDAVAACLDELVAVHQCARPTAPPVAVPDQAPATARLGDRRFVGAAAAAVAASLVAAIVVTAGSALPPVAPMARTRTPPHPVDAASPTGPSPNLKPVPSAPPQPEPRTVTPPAVVVVVPSTAEAPAVAPVRTPVDPPARAASGSRTGLLAGGRHTRRRWAGHPKQRPLDPACRAAAREAWSTGLRRAGRDGHSGGRTHRRDGATTGAEPERRAGPGPDRATDRAGSVATCCLPR